LDRATPITSATLFIARPPSTRASAISPFWADCDLQRLLQDLGLQALLAEKTVQFADLVLERPVIRGRDDLLLGTGRR